MPENRRAFAKSVALLHVGLTVGSAIRFHPFSGLGPRSGTPDEKLAGSTAMLIGTTGLVVAWAPFTLISMLSALHRARPSRPRIRGLSFLVGLAVPWLFFHWYFLLGGLMVDAVLYFLVALLVGFQVLES